MDDMTWKETAVKWGVSPRSGRIPGAVKMAAIWLVPKDTEKPMDGRTKQGKERKHEQDTAS